MSQLLLAEEAVQDEPSLYKAMVYINGKTFLQIDNCYQSVHLFQSISRVDNGNPLWTEAITAFLAISIDRIAERNSSICHYDVSNSISGTFQRYALSFNWDFAEANILSETAGSYHNQLDWICLYIQHGLASFKTSPTPAIVNQSSINLQMDGYDVIITDPPYYDAIPYSDLMDFFYVWLRRNSWKISEAARSVFAKGTSPKWDHEANNEELIDDPSRFGGNNAKSKNNYEEGMAKVFPSMSKSFD